MARKLTLNPADILKAAENKFERTLPYGQRFFMTQEEMGRHTNGTFNLDFFSFPQRGKDGKIRIPTRHPVFQRGPKMSYLCVVDDKTQYGMTTPAVCIFRVVMNNKWAGREPANLDERIEAGASRSFNECMKCPLIAEWIEANCE